MRIHSPLAIPLLWLALTSLCQAAPAAAQPPQPPQASSQQGLTVVRDAETGELRAPSAAESEALRAQTAAPSARPPRPALVTGADGRESVRLGSSRLVYSVVKRGPDGKLDHQCVEGADGVHAHLNHGAPGGAQEKARHDHR